MTRLLSSLLAALGVLFWMAPLASAQSSGSISGVVVDPGGSVTPGVAIVVREEETGVTFRTFTGAAGNYHVPALQAGTYSVTASLAGFKTAEARDIQVALGQPVTVNLKLEVGTLEQTVTVTGAAELVNTETPTVDVTLLSEISTRSPTPEPAPRSSTSLPPTRTPRTLTTPGGVSARSCCGSIGREGCVPPFFIIGKNVGDEYSRPHWRAQGIHSSAA